MVVSAFKQHARINIQFLNLKTITLLFWKGKQLVLLPLVFSKVMGFRQKDLLICWSHMWIHWETTKQQIRILVTAQFQICKLASMHSSGHSYCKLKGQSHFSQQPYLGSICLQIGYSIIFSFFLLTCFVFSIFYFLFLFNFFFLGWGC